MQFFYLTSVYAINNQLYNCKSLLSSEDNHLDSMATEATLWSGIRVRHLQTLFCDLKMFIFCDSVLNSKWHTIGNSLFLQTSKCSNSNCSSKGRLKYVFVSPVIGSTYLSVGFTLGLSNDRKPFQANNENKKWFSFLHQRASGFHFPLFITNRSDQMLPQYWSFAKKNQIIWYAWDSRSALAHSDKAVV